MSQKWTTYQLTIQIIVDNCQQKTAKELEDFYREVLTQYEGTEHHTKWCVIKTVYQFLSEVPMITRTLTSIQELKKSYRKGCLTIGEYYLALGKILVEFEQIIDTEDETFTDLVSHEGYKSVLAELGKL